MRSEDRTLLDLLCFIAPRAAEFDRAFRLREGWGPVITALRNRGLVAFDSLLPSPSALAAFADWQGLAAAPAPPKPQPPAPAPASNRHWTEAEDARIREAYRNGERIDLLVDELPGRSLHAVRRRALDLGLGGTHAAGRGGFAVHPDWSDQDLETLRRLYPTTRAAEIAKLLSRTKAAVTTRAHSLGLKSAFSSEWTEDDRRALEIAHRRGISLGDAALALGRNYSAVAKRAEKSGFSFQRRPRLAQPPTLAQILALDDPAAPLPKTKRAPRPSRVRQPEPWPEERQQAFLEALERTGSMDQALVAIGLRVSSRHAAYRVKYRDKAFSAAWNEALRRSPFRPGRKPKAKAKKAKPAPVPPRVWATRKRQDAFVDALRRVGQIKGALAALDLSNGNSKRLIARQRREDPEFDRRCTDALVEFAGEKLAAVHVGHFAQKTGRLRPPVRPAAIERPAAVSRPAASEKTPLWATAERQEIFVAALRKHGTIRDALLSMGLSAGSTAGYLNQRGKDSAFGARCDDAIRACRAERQTRRPKPRVVQAPRPRSQEFDRSDGEDAPLGAPRLGGVRSRAGDWAGFSFQAERRRPEPPRRHKSDAEIAGESLRYLEERKRVEACGRRDLTVDEAKQLLQRRGLSVFRSSVAGGRDDRWSVSGMGAEVTDEQLIERAERAQR